MVVICHMKMIILFFFFFLRTMRDDYDIDVESPRRIRYDGLRRVSYSLVGFN